MSSAVHGGRANEAVRNPRRNDAQARLHSVTMDEPGVLSAAQVEQFRTQGWIAPIDVFSADKAAHLLAQLEAAEANHPEALAADNRNNAHLVCRFLADLAVDRRIVDAAEVLVGSDISLWSSVLFIKAPMSGSFVSWHQDATYMGLAPDNFVTAWVALSPSTIESGCVSVIPGSHLHGAAAHTDTFGSDNILTRGQTVDQVDESAAVHLELAPGQMSLHHPWLVHGSQPNRTSARRVGVALQSYLGGDVRPSRGEHHVLHIRGAPVARGLVEVSRPTTDFGPAETGRRSAANQALGDVLYDGAAERRTL